jgi:hypothetical protein
MLKIRFFVKAVHVLLLAGTGLFAQTLPPGEVQEFAPGIVSTGRGFTVTFSPDGQDVYFTSREESEGGSRPPLHVYHSHLSKGVWQTAKPISFSSAQWSDLDPFVTMDGREMFFVSTRPAPGKDASKRDMDIWVSELRNGDWAEPHWLEEVNSTAKEGSPSLDRHKNLYFFSDRESQPDRNAIYVSHWHNGHFTAPRKLPEPINAGPSDTSPWIFPNGKALLFYSTRPGGYGKADLYVSFLRHGKWSDAQNLGAMVNTEEFEYNPSVSRDGYTLYFGRGGKTYLVPVEALHISGLPNRRL